MAILLTGGAGYIGSHTAAACAAAGYDVVIADDFSNSSPDVPRRLEEITGRKMAVCRVDAADREAMRAVFAAHSIDAVIHFAGFKAVGESVRKPVKYYRNNLDTTLTLLEVMAEFGCRRLVFSSSATVYGGESPSPLTEDMPVGQCTNPYGRTKYFIEEILRDAAAAEPELSVVLLRYFNPIGAHESGRIGERPNGVPYAAFGLLWKVFGPQLVGEHQARLLDENFVQPLDLNDNTGEQNSLCDAIGFFNPVWDSKEDQDTCFFKAVAVAKQILENQIESANAVNRADEKVQQAYKNSRDGIVILPCYLHNTISCFI